ncbi:MAG TPA: hypothetical protein VFQ45_14205 [Longimicrobium sp.]|nr:hypothetical protein [Longimicrobium sp.]
MAIRAPAVLLLALVVGGCAPPPSASRPPEAAEGRCMERHVREAIALNRERMPRYAALTGGRSAPISRRLIRTEQLTGVVARYVDWRARPFQRAGIRIVCDDFVPMAHTPAFRERVPDPPPLSAFAPADARRIRRAVKQALRVGGFPAASAALEVEIARFSTTPAFHCMLRHLLESALRASSQAPRYAAQARALGLRSPEGLSRMLLDLHLTGLGEAAALDRRAAPLQSEGIPILCQDVPPIPPHADDAATGQSQ